MHLNLWIDCKNDKLTGVKPVDMVGRPLVIIELPFYTSKALLKHFVDTIVEYSGDEVINIKVQIPEY